MKEIFNYSFQCFLCSSDTGNWIDRRIQESGECCLFETFQSLIFHRVFTLDFNNKASNEGYRLTNPLINLHTCPNKTEIIFRL